jgi:hypothetical protein
MSSGVSSRSGKKAQSPSSRTSSPEPKSTPLRSALPSSAWAERTGRVEQDAKRRAARHSPAARVAEREKMRLAVDIAVKHTPPYSASQGKTVGFSRAFSLEAVADRG